MAAIEHFHRRCTQWLNFPRGFSVKKSHTSQSFAGHSNGENALEAHGLRKAFGTTVALNGIDLRLEEGRILGIIGPNGAGKTTALNAILGLIPYQGALQVLGRDPWTQRDQLMRDVAFIA
ncbi:MAG TPA: ATP-binding cassette domain-containing protein, partial [Acidobacteriaceae bacterium]